MEFPGVLANDDVSLDIRRGEVFALVGENGAGKTTLMNILYGINEPTDGEVIIGGTGSLTGSIIGAAFLSALPELMREFSTYRMLAYSVVLVLVMLFRPGGIFGRWEFSLTRALEKLTGRGTVKAKAEKGA